MIIIIFLLRVIFVLSVIAFAMLNSGIVTVDLYWYEIDAPLAQVVLISLLLGYILKYLLPWIFFWKKKKSFLHSS